MVAVVALGPMVGWYVTEACKCGARGLFTTGANKMLRDLGPSISLKVTPLIQNFPSELSLHLFFYHFQIVPWAGCGTFTTRYSWNLDYVRYKWVYARNTSGPVSQPHKLFLPRSELEIQAYKVEASVLRRDSINSLKFCWLGHANKEIWVIK